MEKEDRELLARAVQLGEENNKMLIAMRRNSRITFAFQFIYWCLIIGLSIGAFYFIQPYINAISGGADQAQSSLGTLKDLMQEYGGTQTQQPQQAPQ